MTICVRVVLVLLGLASGLVHSHALKKRGQDEPEPFDPAVCNMKVFNTLASLEDPLPEYPPEGSMHNVGMEMVVRDHFLFEVTMCDNAFVILTPTAVPLETPGYRLHIMSDGTVELGYVAILCIPY